MLFQRLKIIYDEFNLTFTFYRQKVNSQNKIVVNF